MWILPPWLAEQIEAVLPTDGHSFLLAYTVPALALHRVCVQWWTSSRNGVGPAMPWSATSVASRMSLAMISFTLPWSVSSFDVQSQVLSCHSLKHTWDSSPTSAHLCVHSDLHMLCRRCNVLART